MKTLLWSLAALAAAATSPVMAADNTETATATVRYDDLRLGTPQGQKRLERRLNQAARQVCGMNEQRSGTRIRPAEETQCYRQARATAMQRYASLVAANQLGG